MSKRMVFVFCALLVLMASSGFATTITSICPVMTGGNAGGGGGVNPTYIADSGVTNGGCNILITFDASGVSTTYPNAAMSYDAGGDDVLVGILNNGSTPLDSISISGTTAPFGFDGDGACDPTWTFAGGNPCGTATSGYAPQGVTYSNISTDDDSGNVNFTNGVAANGGTAWFSLEGPVDVNLMITPTGVPEPGTLGCIAAGLIGLAALRRKSRA